MFVCTSAVVFIAAHAQLTTTRSLNSVTHHSDYEASITTRGKLIRQQQHLHPEASLHKQKKKATVKTIVWPAFENRGWPTKDSGRSVESGRRGCGERVGDTQPPHQQQSFRIILPRFGQQLDGLGCDPKVNQRPKGADAVPVRRDLCGTPPLLTCN